MSSRLRRIIGTAGLLLALGGPCLAQQATNNATITVNAAHRLGPVNRLVFGDNVEAGDSKHVFGDTTNLPPLHTGTGFWDDQALRPVPFVVARMQEIGLSVLRYPGGSLANTYDWHKAVGPVAARGEWHFGIDEYIATCRAIGAEPQFIVSDYTGTPKDAGDLVEYLNTSAVPGHSWAMLRAKGGHVQPYGVRWFELGNETDNGGGWPRRTFSAEQYAAYANATIHAMRAIDPSVKIGIIAATGKPVGDPWNPAVFRLAGPNADFVVVHKYAVGDDTTSPGDLVMRGCMASADQYEADFQGYHALIRHALGHDLPLALTEYNGSFDAPTPPYRFSLGAALFSADLIRVLLEPSNGILLANYWQAVNGYWGMLRGDGDTWTTKPAYPLRKLWGQHFGKTLLETHVAGPTADFEGVETAKPARGAKYAPAVKLAGSLLNVADLDPRVLAAFGARLEDGVLVYDVKGVSANEYPSFATFPVPPKAKGRGATFEMAYDIRVTPTGPGQGTVSLGLGDARGWEATHSAAKIGGASVDGAWHHFSGIYEARPDTQNVSALVRVEDPAPVINARVEVKNVSVTASLSETFPAYALLTSTASLSGDGRTLYVIVFNKSTDQDIPATLNAGSARVSGAKVWTVAGPDLQCTETGPGGVQETETGADAPLEAGHLLHHVFPARSMTALELAVHPLAPNSGRIGTEAPVGALLAAPSPLAPPELGAGGRTATSELPAAQAGADPIPAHAYRILFVGNSITQHGFNADTLRDLHWDHLSGMAASDQGHDYVHRLLGKIRATMPERPIAVRMTSLVPGGLGTTPERLAPVVKDSAGFRPDLVIIQHGEHEQAARGAEAVAETYNALLDLFDKATPRPRIVCVGNWSLDLNAGGTGYADFSATVEHTMQDICVKRGIPFVSVASVAADPLCHGAGQNPGVQWHPNDRGHAKYADLVFAAVEKLPALSRANLPPRGNH